MENAAEKAGNMQGGVGVGRYGVRAGEPLYGPEKHASRREWANCTRAAGFLPGRSLHDCAPKERNSMQKNFEQKVKTESCGFRAVLHAGIDGQPRRFSI